MNVSRLRRHVRLPWPGVAAVVVGIAFLTWGWSWIASALPDGEPVRPGTHFPLGDEARVTVPHRGWEMSESDSTADISYRLTRGEVDVIFSYAVLAAEDSDAWAGAAALLRLADRTLGPAQPATVDGLPARVGRVSGGGDVGTLTVVAPKGDQWSVTTAVLGPPDAAAGDRAAARALVGSLDVKEAP
ncbi:hypothetical protein [Streptomyces luteolus]|uniref:Secreted protein n=1 Tax=Streptomyces luteolus TaxID=3043615 RepID=A0ABT6T1P0_9ACTN|nr:hypothetical protein [Streptomyces sp. B-S-A12]MDI3421751.1 hypothetical protein [Streptomyces sp. B-S-A12]